MIRLEINKIEDRKSRKHVKVAMYFLIEWNTKAMKCMQADKPYFS